MFKKTLFIGIMAIAISIPAISNSAQLEDSLVQLAAEINKSLPGMLTPDMRIDNAQSIGEKIIYRVSLLNGIHEKIDLSSMQKHMTNFLSNKICHDGKLKPFIEKGAIFSYSFFEPQGDNIATIDIGSSVCK